MKQVIAILIFGILASAAHAQERLAGQPGWYAGIGLGSTTVVDPLTGDDVANQIAAGIGAIDAVGTLNTSEDDTDSAWKVMAGYQINQIVGVEAFYSDLGEASAEAVGSGTIFTVSGTFTGEIAGEVQHEADVFGVAANVGYPLTNSLRLYGKVGLFLFETETHATARLDGVLGGVPGAATETASESEDGSSVLAGIGLSFALNRNFTLVAELERYADIEVADGESDVDVVSAALQYHF